MIEVILVILGLGLLIFVHEFGHFIFAKINGVKVLAFSLGFGPAIYKFQWKGTEYRLSIIPLGGYVKMEGEMPIDGEVAAPDSFASKTPFKRFTILVAGVAMNFLITFPLVYLAFVIGRNMDAPIVGVPGPMESAAGIKPGDKIVSVDGKPVDSLNDYSYALAVKAEGTELQVVVEREGKQLARTVKRPPSIQIRNIMPASNFVTADPPPDSASARAGLKKGDEIVSVNGIEVHTNALISKILTESGGGDVKVVVLRDGQKLELILPVDAEPGYEIPEDLHLVRPMVGDVPENSPVFGKLLPNDLIKEVEGVPIPCVQELKEELKKHIGRQIKIKVQREGSDVTIDATPYYDPLGYGILGFNPKTDDRIVAHVDKSPFYQNAGLMKDDEIDTIYGVSLPRFHSTFGIFTTVEKESSQPRRMKGTENPQALRVKIRRKENNADVWKELSIIPRQTKIVNMEKEKLGLVADHKRVLVRMSAGDAIWKALESPVVLFVDTIAMLKRVFSGGESASNLAGPVGVITISTHVAEQGIGNLLWLLALISVNLGIINLLPLPLLDGGLVTLLIYEVIRGRPPGRKFLEAYQYAGIFIILSLVVFATYNDFRRGF